MQVIRFLSFVLGLRTNKGEMFFNFIIVGLIFCPLYYTMQLINYAGFTGKIMNSIISKDAVSNKERDVARSELKNSNPHERIKTYRSLGFTKQALNDDYFLIRIEAYKFFGFNEKAFEDENSSIRLEAYRKLGFTERALKDNDFLIRLLAYQALGFTENAFEDTSVEIRTEAYEELGYTSKALNDEEGGIRARAYEELGFTKNALEDECVLIREDALEYFENCQAVLGLSEIKYEFTEDEKELLRINGIPVFEMNGERN